jgi:hypothetical protein
MEIPGSTYLYALATVSITFVGFSGLAMIFRPAMGGAVTKYDTFFTLSFVQTGLALHGDRRDPNWRSPEASRLRQLRPRG